MALTFLLIGKPVQRLGKIHGLITPPELVFHLTGSPVLRLLFFVVMTAFLSGCLTAVIVQLYFRVLFSKQEGAKGKKDPEQKSDDGPEYF